MFYLLCIPIKTELLTNTLYFFLEKSLYRIIRFYMYLYEYLGCFYIFIKIILIKIDIMKIKPFKIT